MPGTTGTPVASNAKRRDVLTASRRRFLRSVRNRIRIAWITATAQRYAPYVVGVLALVFLAGWLTPFDRVVEVAVGVVGVALLALLVGVARLRITDWDAARAAERGLEVRDVLTTSLEFTDETDETQIGRASCRERGELSGGAGT